MLKCLVNRGLAPPHHARHDLGSQRLANYRSHLHSSRPLVGLLRSASCSWFHGDHPKLWLDLGIALITLLAVQMPVAQASFITAPSYAAGSYPTSVAVGDFNGDAIPDLVVANASGNGNGAMSVLLGNGDGTFR